MEDRENIKLILKDYYPCIDEFLGDAIDKRLEMPSYEDGLLTSQLLKAAHRLPSYKEEYPEDEYYEDEDYESEGYRLDSGLYLLDKTLSYGEEYCEGFNFIFQNINFSRYQEADNRITEMLAQVKAFEYLSKLGFRNITTIDSLHNRLQVDYIARESGDYYAIVVTCLYSAKHSEEHRSEYDENHVMRLLATDISNAINQKYPQLKDFCQKTIGVKRGIIFISSCRDYFGYKKYENKLYGLRPPKVSVVLNKEWRKRKEGQEYYKYLHHVVITTGRNVRNAITYPSMN